MPSRLDYARLLTELNDHLADADGQAIRDWLHQQGTSDRVRRDTFVPTSLSALKMKELSPLQSGDVVSMPIIAQKPSFTIPSGCQIESPVQVMGTLEIQRGVRASETLCAGERLIWGGGKEGEVQNLIAPHITIEAPPGRVRGGIWCDTLSADSQSAHLPATLRVDGAVVVDKPDGAVLVGHGVELGGLVAQGAVNTEYGVTISTLIARDDVQLGRDCRAGSIVAANVRADRDCRLGAVISRGTITLGADCIVESLHAEGDITFEAGVVVTGDVISTQSGTLLLPPGDGWSSQRTHWFYALPDQSLVPFRPDVPRPEQSALLALRSLTHSLWQQTNQVAGRNT